MQDFLNETYKDKKIKQRKTTPQLRHSRRLQKKIRLDYQKLNNFGKNTEADIREALENQEYDGSIIRDIEETTKHAIECLGKPATITDIQSPRQAITTYGWVRFASLLSARTYSVSLFSRRVCSA